MFGVEGARAGQPDALQKRNLRYFNIEHSSLQQWETVFVVVCMQPCELAMCRQLHCKWLTCCIRSSIRYFRQLAGWSAIWSSRLWRDCRLEIVRWNALVHFGNIRFLCYSCNMRTMQQNVNTSAGMSTWSPLTTNATYHGGCNDTIRFSAPFQINSSNLVDIAGAI